MQRLRVAVLCGGRSGEHEVSVNSAESIIAAMDPGRYEVERIFITKEGRWQPRAISPEPDGNPGIDVVFRGNQERLEYDFEIGAVRGIVTEAETMADGRAFGKEHLCHGLIDDRDLGRLERIVGVKIATREQASSKRFKKTIADTVQIDVGIITRFGGVAVDLQILAPAPTADRPNAH